MKRKRGIFTIIILIIKRINTTSLTLDNILKVGNYSLIKNTL